MHLRDRRRSTGTIPRRSSISPVSHRGQVQVPLRPGD